MPRNAETTSDLITVLDLDQLDAPQRARMRSWLDIAADRAGVPAVDVGAAILDRPGVVILDVFDRATGTWRLHKAQGVPRPPLRFNERGQVRFGAVPR